MDAADVAIRVVGPETLEEWYEAFLDLYELVAAEGLWIGGEAPVDRDRMRRYAEATWLSGDEPTAFVLAEHDGVLRGALSVSGQRGVGHVGMMVADGWRGAGLGTRMLVAGIEWARGAGLHKLTLEVWPHNRRGIALYRRCGFVVEGRRRRHHRRRSGELWDSIEMGLVLDETSPGSPWGDEPPG